MARKRPPDSGDGDDQGDGDQCGHPLAFGVCWYSQIDEPCPRQCRWLIDRPTPR